MRARPGLSRDAVVRAAAELLDASAGREVTLGEIAARLGVRAPSLYNHIEGQEELHRELALFGLRELGGRLGHAAIGKAGDAALLAIGEAYRTFARERPGLYLATLRAPGPGEPALQEAGEEVIEVLRIVLEPYTLSDEETIHAIRGLRSIAHGFVSLELGGGFGIPLDLDESFRRLLETFVQGLPGYATARPAAIATAAG
ncbi:MAG TPA: TetR-like C-terminal domain-containing protein [Thermomicrobiaceae bacterium]|nr:TetR-like C-terminal domain-containing protein [Thermomicrobiaceae bacterium]